MCTVLKCDPEDSANTCTQDLLSDYNFLSTSDTVFRKLKLSGTFSDEAAVYPEVLFNDVKLKPELVNVSSDGKRYIIIYNSLQVLQEFFHLLKSR